MAGEAAEQRGGGKHRALLASRGGPEYSTVHDMVKDLYDDCTLRMDRFFADACSLGIE